MKITLNTSTLIGVAFLFYGCSFSDGEDGMALIPKTSEQKQFDLKIHIDPVTKKPISPPIKQKRDDGSQSIPPTIVHSEIKQGNGTAILEPNFKPRHMLTVSKGCDGVNEVKHSTQADIAKQAGKRHCIGKKIGGDEW